MVEFMRFRWIILAAAAAMALAVPAASLAGSSAVRTAGPAGLGGTCNTWEATFPGSGLQAPGGKNGYVHDTYAPTKVVAPPAAAGPLVSGGTISVYFHVINNGTGIAQRRRRRDSQIASQINVLNAAYAPRAVSSTWPATDRTTNATWYTVRRGTTAETQMKNALRKGGTRTTSTSTPTTSAGGLLGWATFPSGLRLAARRWTASSILFSSLPGGTRRAVQPGRHGDPRGRPLDGPVPHVPGRLHRDARATASRHARREVGRVRLPDRPRHLHRRTPATTRSTTSWTTPTTPA